VRVGSLIDPNDVLIPVYRTRVGVPPKDGFDQSGAASGIENDSRFELVGYRVHHILGTAGEGRAVTVVNPVQTVNTATRIDGQVEEIGRASCRERVWRADGGVSLQQKRCGKYAAEWRGEASGGVGE